MPQTKIKTALRGTVTARVETAEIMADGTGRITLVVPIEPEGLAYVEARLQPTERAKVAWKCYYMATGMQKGDPLTDSIGRYLLIECHASCDDWGVWHTNRITRYNRCRPEQAEACRASLERIIPLVEAKEKAEAAEAKDTTITEADIPEAPDLPYADELPF